MRNHPLPDENKRCALLAMREFIARNGLPWAEPPGGQYEVASMIEDLAARRVSEEDFAAWLGERVGAHAETS